MYLHRHQHLSSKDKTISSLFPLQKDAFPHASFGDPPTSRLSSVELYFQVPTLSHGVFLVIVHRLLCVCLTVTHDQRRILSSLNCAGHSALIFPIFGSNMHGLSRSSNTSRRRVGNNCWKRCKNNIFSEGTSSRYRLGIRS